MGRPKKVRHAKDDGKVHRIFEFVDHKLMDDDGNIDPDRLAVWTCLSKPDCCRKFKLAKERGEQGITTGIGGWHGQGRCSFRSPHGFEYVRKLFGCHVEFTACTDDWSYFHKMDAPNQLLIDEDYRQQGKRNVFAEQKDLIQLGATVSDCVNLPGANFQSFRAAEVLMAYIEPKRAYGDVKAYFPTGESLSEIRKRVHEKEGANLYTLPDGFARNCFWTGYDAHEAVLIDCPLDGIDALRLRRFIGAAPFVVNTKGGARQARYKRIYVIRPPDDFRH